MSDNRFLYRTVLKVKATRELLFQGNPYILVLYTDTITGNNYVKAYRYKLVSDKHGWRVSHIDTSHPVRSYRYDELCIVDMKRDDKGYTIENDIPMSNSTILSEGSVLSFCTFTSTDINYDETER